MPPPHRIPNIIPLRFGAYSALTRFWDLEIVSGFRNQSGIPKSIWDPEIILMAGNLLAAFLLLKVQGVQVAQKNRIMTENQKVDDPCQIDGVAGNMAGLGWAGIIVAGQAHRKKSFLKQFLVKFLADPST